jgi:hypothetical protein
MEIKRQHGQLAIAERGKSRSECLPSPRIILNVSAVSEKSLRNEVESLVGVLRVAKESEEVRETN